MVLKYHLLPRSVLFTVPAGHLPMFAVAAGHVPLLTVPDGHVLMFAVPAGQAPLLTIPAFHVPLFSVPSCRPPFPFSDCYDKFEREFVNELVKDEMRIIVDEGKETGFDLEWNDERFGHYVERAKAAARIGQQLPSNHNGMLVQEQALASAYYLGKKDSKGLVTPPTSSEDLDLIFGRRKEDDHLCAKAICRILLEFDLQKQSSWLDTQNDKGQRKGLPPVRQELFHQLTCIRIISGLPIIVGHLNQAVEFCKSRSLTASQELIVLKACVDLQRSGEGTAISTGDDGECLMRGYAIRALQNALAHERRPSNNDSLQKFYKDY